MISHWPIRLKLRVGLGSMAVSIALLFGAALYGLYAYRALVKSLNARSAELPWADKLSDHVGQLRVILAKAHERKANQGEENENFVSMLANPDAIPREKLSEENFIDNHFALNGYHTRYLAEMGHFEATLTKYRHQLEASVERADARIGDYHNEEQTLAQIEQVLLRINPDELSVERFYREIDKLEKEVDTLGELASQLPSYLHQRLHELAGDVRSQYRLAIPLAWATFLIAVVVMGMAILVFRRTIARPIVKLVEGSRRVAAGDFNHRIRLESRDEIGELAEAMNEMTKRFQNVYDDLDQQVRERTAEVVRSEQLASVGFLAAGVAHEINNPLASIALCSESIENRMEELVGTDVEKMSPEWQVVHSYLAMIQKEAFRCKQITEKLLDFSRMGDSEKHATELRSLAEDVVEMLLHLGKYNDKKVILDEGEPVIADVNAQEMKQVVLNLITNGLDSLESGGEVRVAIDKHDGMARLRVSDNGCGMTPEVIQHLFEPFFTRSRGGQGTGLGLSITCRIVTEHGGNIQATSEGMGKGSRFIVTLPLAGANRQAA